MQVKFMFNGKEKYGWLSMESFRNDITILNNQWKDEIQLPIIKNTDSKLCFIYNGQEVLLNSMMHKSMAEIRQIIERNNSDTKTDNVVVTTYDFVTAIIADGVENVRLGAEMPVPDSIIPALGISMYGEKYQYAPCKLKKSYNSEPHRGYKLELVVDREMMGDEENKQYPFMGSWRTYTDDIFSMIKSGIIKILDSKPSEKTPEQNIDEYFEEYYREFVQA